MPLYDYLCVNEYCQTHFERMLSISDYSDVVTCECGSDANRIYVAFAPRQALRFDPIVVDRIKLPDGSFKYSYPGRNTDPIDPGYERVSLSTMDQYSRFCQDRDREEGEIRCMNIEGERNYWDKRAEERHVEARRQLELRLGKSHSRIGEIIWEKLAAKRKRKYDALAARSIEFHSQAMEMDRSNRSEYRDDSRRKISVVVNGSRA